MKKLTKSQKQLIGLAAVLATIVIVLAIFVFKAPVSIEGEVFVPKTLDSQISKTVLGKPEYPRLTLPIALPLVPGKTGRPNPFAPY